MRCPVKATVLLILVGALLAAGGWVGGFFYWHFRITRALREWEKETCAWDLVRYRRTSGAAPGVSGVLDEAGCRALPYLVQSLDAPGKPAFKAGVVDRTLQCLCGRTPRGQEAVAFYLKQYDAWDIARGDSPQQREAKIQRVLAWWREHRTEFHQGWRIWSPACHSWPAP